MTQPSSWMRWLVLLVVCLCSLPICRAGSPTINNHDNNNNHAVPRLASDPRVIFLAAMSQVVVQIAADFRMTFPFVNIPIVQTYADYYTNYHPSSIVVAYCPLVTAEEQLAWQAYSGRDVEDDSSTGISCPLWQQSESDGWQTNTDLRSWPAVQEAMLRAEEMQMAVQMDLPVEGQLAPEARSLVVQPILQNGVVGHIVSLEKGSTESTLLRLLETTYLEEIVAATVQQVNEMAQRTWPFYYVPDGVLAVLTNTFDALFLATPSSSIVMTCPILTDDPAIWNVFALQNQDWVNDDDNDNDIITTIAPEIFPLVFDGQETALGPPPYCPLWHHAPVTARLVHLDLLSIPDIAQSLEESDHGGDDGTTIQVPTSAYPVFGLDDDDGYHDFSFLIQPIKDDSGNNNILGLVVVLKASVAPTSEPSAAPSLSLSVSPTVSLAPTQRPTNAPIQSPTDAPSAPPTRSLEASSPAAASQTPSPTASEPRSTVMAESPVASGAGGLVGVPLLLTGLASAGCVLV